MKSSVLTLSLAAVMLSSVAAPVAAETALAVMSIENQVAGLPWWNPDVAREFQDSLTSALRSRDGVQARKTDAQLPKGADASRTLQQSTLEKLVRPGDDYLVACSITTFQRTSGEGGTMTLEATTRVVEAETGEIVVARARASGKNRDQVLKGLMTEIAAKVLQRVGAR